MASFDVPKRLHAAQHAAGQPDAITPASIGAAPASRFLTGTGSPEGVTAAPVGTTYTDTGGTNGAWQWLKKIGAGTTGWAVTNGDTGNRRVESLMITENGYTGGGLYLRRTGNVCTITASNLSRETAGVGYQRILVTPVGFRPFAPIYFAPFVGTAYGYLTDAELTLSGPTTGNNFSLTWITKDPWPTTLPGTPG